MDEGLPAEDEDTPTEAPDEEDSTEVDTPAETEEVEDSEDVEEVDDSEESDEADEDEDVPASVQQRFDEMAEQRRGLERELTEAKAQSAYLTALNTRMEESDIKSSDMDAWIQLGFDVQSDAEQAPYTFLQLAVNTGLSHEQIAEALGIVAAPAGALDADLQKMVDAFDLSEEAAATLQAGRPAAKASTTIQRPAHRPASEQAAPTALPSLGAPTGVSEDQATDAVAAIDAEYAAKYPQEWPKWRAELRTKLAEQTGLPLSLWASTTRDLAELVVQSHKQAPVKPGRSSLRGGGKRPPAKPKDTNSRASLLDRMTSGSILS